MPRPLTYSDSVACCLRCCIQKALEQAHAPLLGSDSTADEMNFLAIYTTTQVCAVANVDATLCATGKQTKTQNAQQLATRYCDACRCVRDHAGCTCPAHAFRWFVCFGLLHCHGVSTFAAAARGTGVQALPDRVARHAAHSRLSHIRASQAHTHAHQRAPPTFDSSARGSSGSIRH